MRESVADLNGGHYAPNVDKAARDARQTELLVQRFRSSGVTVADAVPAFAGMHPIVGGFTSTGWPCVRWRILALDGSQVQVWTAWSGPTPKKLLGSADRRDVVVGHCRFAYAKVTVGDHRVWVHRRDLPTLERWRATRLLH